MNTWNFGSPAPSCATVNCGSANALMLPPPGRSQTLPTPAPIGMNHASRAKEVEDVEVTQAGDGSAEPVGR